MSYSMEILEQHNGVRASFVVIGKPLQNDIGSHGRRNRGQSCGETRDRGLVRTLLK